MQLTNYLDHNTKLNIISTTMLATAGGLVYYKGINKELLCLLAIPLFTSYYSSEILSFITEHYSEKCDIDHPLCQTVSSLIDKNDCFADLKKIDVFIIDSNDRQAFACGFGKNKSAIYVYDGLIKCFGNDYSDNRLKAVIAHELGHISGNHIIWKTVINTFEIINYFLLPILPIPYFTNLLKNLNEFITAFFSRQIEYDADRIATDCGLGPDLVDGLMEVASTPRPHKDSFRFGVVLDIKEFFSTHPSIYNRAAEINAHLMEQNTDYDNWYDWFGDSVSHTFARFNDQFAIHYEAYSRMIGLTEDLNQYRVEHI